MSFYEACPISQQGVTAAEKASRLTLCQATAKTLTLACPLGIQSFSACKDDPGLCAQFTSCQTQTGRQECSRPGKARASNNAPFPMVRAVLAGTGDRFCIFLYHISGSSGETEEVTDANRLQHRHRSRLNSNVRPKNSSTICSSCKTRKCRSNCRMAR